MTRSRTRATALALSLSFVGLGLGLGLGAGVASADPPRVIIEPPFFVPEADFHHERGYYRTDDGHYYHYDRDRSGWHYGRNHDEGIRYEHEHEGRHGDHHR